MLNTHTPHAHKPFLSFFLFFLPEKAFRQDAQLSTPVISDCIRKKNKSQQFRNFQTQSLSQQPIFRACSAWQDYGCMTAWVSLPGYWAFGLVHSFGFLLRGGQSPGQKKKFKMSRAIVMRVMTATIYWVGSACQALFSVIHVCWIA